MCGLGYCSRGGGYVQAAQGTAPVFWGDCTCRAATAEEWRKNKNSYLNASMVPNNTYPGNPLAAMPVGYALRWTFWDSNPCGYAKEREVTWGRVWSGADCRLVRPPFLKYMMGWGDTRAGQLSRQLADLSSPDDQPQNLFRPTQIASLDGVDLMAVAAGDFHAAAIAAAQPHAVCNLTRVHARSRGVSVEEGGFGPEVIDVYEYIYIDRSIYLSVYLSRYIYI